MTSPINNRVRGVRQTLPPNTLVGRTTGKGPAQQIPMNQLAQALVQGGSIPLPQPGLSPIASGDVLANTTGGSAIPVATAVTALLDFVMGSTEGQILQRGATVWQVLAPGTANQVLKSGGAAALNAWAGLSALLDSVFGSTEGQILQRGSSAWQILAPGTAGQVLTSGGAAALNSWTTPATAGTTISNAGAFNSLSGYSVGQVVQFNGVSYLCYSAVTAPSGGAQQWDPANFQGAAGAISTTNTTNDTITKSVTGGSFSGQGGNVGRSSGLLYFEATCPANTDNLTSIGIGTFSRVHYISGQAIGNINGDGGGGQGSGSWPGFNQSSTNHLGVAVDLNAGTIWCCNNVQASPQNWNGSTSNAPGGSGGIAIGTNLLGATCYAYAEFQSSTTDKFVLFTTLAGFLGAVPAGYNAWNAATTPNPTPDLDDAHWLSQTVPAAYIGIHALLGGL